MPADLKQLSRRWFEEVWNRRRAEVIEQMLAHDVIAHGLGESPDSGPAGVSQFIAFWEKFCGAFPDIRIDVEDVIAEGDRSAVRLSFGGTHDGHHLGIQPSGKSVRATALCMMRWRDGQIVEAWNEFDAMGLMRQVGAI